ncbi:hypothetical protein D3C87_1631900 [compost metagenome]
MAAGVLAGAAMPYQSETSIPGRPCSASVETSGKASIRLSTVTPSTFTLPDFSNSTALSADRNMRSICPLNTWVIAGAVPGKGTCRSSTRAVCSINAIAACAVLPIPQLAADTEPGFCFAARTRSGTVAAFELGLATSAKGMTPMNATGSRSFEV